MFRAISRLTSNVYVAVVDISGARVAALSTSFSRNTAADDKEYEFLEIKNADISGNWVNELGSHVTFQQDGQMLTGTYQSKVSEYPIPNSFPLNGNIGTGSPTSLGFTVSYQGEDDPEEKSTAAWSGQYRKLENGTETIYTTWSLTEPAEEDDGVWRCTRIGKDTFIRE